MKDFKFKKHIPTIVVEKGQHILVNENGVIGGQIKSVVIDKCDENTVAKITFEVNLCATMEEAMGKYK